MPRGSKANLSPAKPVAVVSDLARSTKLKPPFWAWGLPYFTIDNSETEYLISNPNSSTITGELHIYGKERRQCKELAVKRVRLAPNCTQTFKIRNLVPEQAGYSVLLMPLKVVGHILYYEHRGTAIAGGELGDGIETRPIRDFRIGRVIKPRPPAETYALGYRATPLLKSPIKGAVYVSNPWVWELTGGIAFYDQNCQIAKRYSLKIPPHCTGTYEFPKNKYGYACVSISHAAIINVLHFDTLQKRLAAAELVGPSHKSDCRTRTSSAGKRILMDYTHGCRPGNLGDWTDYESMLVAAGYPVSHHTAATVTLATLKRYDAFVVVAARSVYSESEKEAISRFVAEGGGLLIVTDIGNDPCSAPTRELLNYFSTSDYNNCVMDSVHNRGGDPTAAVFDYERNFVPHVITQGLKVVTVGGTCTLSAKVWNEIIVTDANTSPPEHAVAIERPYDKGRIVATGDSDAWSNRLLGLMQNAGYAGKTIQWLLKEI